MSNSKKESFALRQQKYTNAIIRGRRHVPTPEAIPPSSLLDAPQLPPVPLPSPPREPLPEPRYRRPKHLVTNLNKRQPAPKGGFTAVNRYSKTPTNPDENAKVFNEYAERLTDIQQKQNNMGKDKPRKRRTSRRVQTPAHVSMIDSLENEENLTEVERYVVKMDSMKTVQDSMGVDRTKSKKSRKPAKAPTSRKTVEDQQPLERIPTAAEYDDWMERTVGEFYAPTPTMDREEDRIRRNASRTAEVEQALEADTKQKAIKKQKKKRRKTCMETSPDFTANVGLDHMSATSVEVYTPDWEEEGRARSCYYTPSQPGHLSREDSTPTMDREKDCEVYTPDWEEEDQVQSCYSMSSQSGHQSRLDNTPTMDWEKDCEVRDLDLEEEDRVQSCNTSPQPGHLNREDDTPIKNSTKGWMYIIRKNALEEMMATGHDRDEDSLHRRTPVQGKTTKKSHRPRKEKIVLPSLTADPGLILEGTKLHHPGVSLPSIGDGALSTAALPSIPDEDIGTKLPQLQFGTKRVGKTTSDTVTFKQPGDKSNVRSTKRRQKTDRALLKEKKSQKRRHHSSDRSSPDS
ncbi:Hypp2660 [Branchiostoma lanceolatum]|uniref:Hypp2660 protein n=1 Tax=Branchiostoma lanceolatum TaxID=7740 RepID=A0A8K0ERG1_BRALA|nr:Hypp2660 [Branchiostoma lanceolatum]